MWEREPLEARSSKEESIGGNSFYYFGAFGLG